MSPKVLFTASTDSHIRSFHRPYLKAFRDMGWTVHVACGGAGDGIPEANRVQTLPFEKRIGAFANFRAMRMLRSMMRENRYDLICAHTALAAFFTRLAALTVAPRPPVVVIVHGYLFRFPPEGWREKLLLRAEELTARATDLLLTMNGEDERIASTYRLCRRSVRISGMGVDFSGLDAPDAAEVRRLRARIAPEKDHFLLICPAEFSERKNQAVLLRAMSLLPDRVRLVLPGEGTLLESCRALARQLGVGKRVWFPGYVRDLAPWYAAADAAVFASRSEGLPFSVMEAMHAKLPVVASAVKGHSDLIAEGESGLLYPCGDAGALARQVSRLLEQPELAFRLAQGAGNSAAAYSLEKILPRVMELYLSAAGCAARSDRREEAPYETAGEHCGSGLQRGSLAVPLSGESAQSDDF